MNLADRLTGHVANELSLKPTNQLRTANAWRCAAGTHVQNDLVTSFNDLQAERSKSLVDSPGAPRHPTLNGDEGQAQGSDSFDNLGLPRGSALPLANSCVFTHVYVLVALVNHSIV